MSYTSAYPRYPVGYDPRRRRHGRTRAATWIIKASVMAMLGVAGYLFVMEVAFPGLAAGIFGAH